MNTIFTRTSVRKYLNKPVEEDKIMTILKAGLQAPSACNQQPWEFFVVTNKAKLEELSAMSPYSAMVKDAPAAIVCGMHTDCMVPDMACQDCSIAMENIWLETTDQGLGGVWLGTYPDEERMEKVRKILLLPDNLKAFAVFPLGYPDGPVTPKVRDDETKIHWVK